MVNDNHFAGTAHIVKEQVWQGNVIGRTQIFLKVF